MITKLKNFQFKQNVAVAQKRPKWRPAREKDFKPDELGKTPPAYRCEVNYHFLSPGVAYTARLSHNPVTPRAQ